MQQNGTTTAKAKPWAKSLTILFAIATVAAGVAEQALDVGIVPAGWVGGVVAGVGVINAILRVRTKQPLSTHPTETQAREVEAGPLGVPVK